MAQDHSTQHIGTIATTARDNGMPGKTAHGGCNACDRRGLTFLPVRYAVGDLRDVRAYTLPSDKVAAFTTLTLDKGIDKDGNEVARPPVSGYLLRKLRKGYLYVYDAHPLTPGWQCFAVSEYGELKGFPMDNPTPLADITPMSDCPHGMGHPARASLVSLPDAKTPRAVYLMFLEIPLGPTRLTQIAQDKAWRDAHMQSFKVGNEAGSPHYFAQDAIPRHVPEYDDDNAFLYRTLEHQLWPGRHSDMHTSLAAKRSQLDAFAQLNTHMDEIHRTGQVKAPPFMFAVKDEVGIIEQLDALRVLPLATFKADMLPDDQSREGVPANRTLNQRNYRWYLAVKQLHELMEQMPVRGVEVDKDFKPQASSPTYTEAMTHAAELSSSSTMTTRYIKNDPGLMKSASESIDRAYNEAWNTQRRYELDARDKAKKELLRYYQGTDWQSLDRIIAPYIKAIEKDAPGFDADYARWMCYHLYAALARYDQQALYHGGYITKLISDLSLHGVMGDGSRWLWQQMALLKDKGQLLLRAYTLNMPEPFKALADALQLEKGSTYLEDGKKLTEGVKKSFDKAKALYDAYKKQGLSKRLVVGPGAIAKFMESLQKLNDVNIHVQSSLWADELKDTLDRKQVTAQSYSIGARGRMGLYSFQALAHTVDDLVQERTRSTLGTKTFTITLGELNTLTEHMHRQYVGVGGASLSRSAAKLSEPGRINGNFANLKHDSQVSVSLTLVGDKAFLDRLDAHFKASRVTLNGTLAGWHGEHMAAFNKEFASLSGRVTFAGTKLALITSFYEASQKLYAKPADLDAWKEGVSTLLSLIQGTLETGVLYRTHKTEALLNQGASMKERLLSLEARALSRETAGTASGRILTTQRFTVLAKSLGLLGTALGVYDLFVGLSKAQAMQQGGELRADVMNQYVSTGLKFVGGVVIGLMFSSFLIGLVIGLGLLYLSTFFDPKHLVPQCLQRWLRRSKFGQERETVQGRAFRDMSEEQDALRTVLRGITVSMDIERVKTQYKAQSYWERVGSSAPIETAMVPRAGSLEVESVEKKVTLTVSVPKDMKGVMKVSFKNNADLYVDANDLFVHFNGKDIDKCVSIYEIDRDAVLSKADSDNSIGYNNMATPEKKMLLINKEVPIKGDFVAIENIQGVEKFSNIKNVMVDTQTTFSLSATDLLVSIARTTSYGEVKKDTHISADIGIFTGNEKFSDIFRANV